MRLFKILSDVIIWLLDNSLGLLFTKELRAYGDSYKKDHKVWPFIKKLLLIVFIMFLVFNFPIIYDNTLNHIFVFIFKSLGSLFKNNMFGTILTEFGPNFAKGIGVTLYLSLFGTVIGLFFALFLSPLLLLKNDPKDSKVKKFFKFIAKKATSIYTTVIRGTPMMVQAMVLYWGLISVFKWDYLTAALVTVSLNTTAYLTEVLRGAIESIDKGQMEASLSLGLSKFQTLLYVIYPQAIKNSMASIGNEFVINIKDTSVLSVILVVDIFRVADMARSKYFNDLVPFLIAALIYLFLTYSITRLLRFIEKKLDIPNAELPSSN